LRIERIGIRNLLESTFGGTRSTPRALDFRHRDLWVPSRA
jgi:hypothetical protein